MDMRRRVVEAPCPDPCPTGPHLNVIHLTEGGAPCPVTHGRPSAPIEGADERREQAMTSMRDPGRTDAESARCSGGPEAETGPERRASSSGRLLRPMTGDGVRPAASLGRRRLSTQSPGPSTDRAERADRADRADGHDPRPRPPRRPRSRSRTYYLPDDLHFRLRNAWWHTRTRHEHDSLSALVAAALRPLVEELETRWNDGRPFPELPTGRRLTSGPRPHAHAGTRRSALEGEHVNVPSGGPGDVAFETRVEDGHGGQHLVPWDSDELAPPAQGWRDPR